MVSAERQLKQSVQQKPKVSETGGTTLTFGRTNRGPLLPAFGTRERLRAQLNIWRADYNDVYRPGVIGLAQRVESTEWQITADDDVAAYYQSLLQNADFSNWGNFVAKLVKDFNRYDIGAWVEIIGPGRDLTPEDGEVYEYYRRKLGIPDGYPIDGSQTELVGAPTGIAILDPLRIYPTGDPTYPAIYYNLRGGIHMMHHTRVHQFADSLDSDQYAYGYGDCSLTRCIAPISRQMLIGRYIDTQLDDQPAPGVHLFNNITDQQVHAAIERMQREKATDSGGEWGRVMRIYGLQPDKPVSVESVQFTSPPEKFDYQQYTEIDVKKIALGLGVDIQDLWELTQSNGLGTGTQSRILHRKASGKAIGVLLRGIERMIDNILPEDATFEFKVADPDDDQQRADLAASWANTVNVLSADLSQSERRAIIANKVEAIGDVITDESGQVTRLTDTGEIQGDDVSTLDDTSATQAVDDGSDPANVQDKEIRVNRREFRSAFRQIVQDQRDGVLSEAMVRTALRGDVFLYGERAYLDGLREAGNLTPDTVEEGQEFLAKWRADQRQNIRRFASELVSKGLTDTQLDERATLWVNMSIDPAYYEGLADGNRNQRYLWVYDPTKENCVTCLRLNGQIHRMKDYTSRGLIPRSRALVCGGWNCGCQLMPTDQPARGRFRSVRYVRGRRSHQHRHTHGLEHVH